MRQIKKQGYTLLEITFVVAIIGIIAAAIIPFLSPGNTIKLDLAAEEITAATRFARNEAIRTGTPHGINTNTSTDHIRVYSKPGVLPAYDVRNPVDKKLYDINLISDIRLSGVSLDNAVFSFDGGFNSTSYLEFNSDGIPKYSSSGTDYMLTSASITLKYENHQRVISIAPMTGRVTIQ